jgi:hypothetical protein
VTVDVLDLDTFVLENGLKNLNVLKLDIEGYELEALKGSKKLLAEQMIDAIYTEVSFVRSYAGQPLYHNLTLFLEGCGYHVYNFDNDPGETEVRQATMGNATYISEKHRSFVEARRGKTNCGW